MNILITAGGTSEPIDAVRSITNHSTGSLGKMIAEHFLAQKHAVTYLTTVSAVRPAPNSDLTIFEIDTTKDLESTIKTITQTQTFDAIIHSMAVSDFTSETAFPEEAFIELLSEKLAGSEHFNDQLELTKKIRSSLNELCLTTPIEKKIPSQTDRLLLSFKKNPKIIAMLKKLQPNAILVGFKLLVGVSKAELLQVAHKILEKNHCDFVLANDLEQIDENKHVGYLIDSKKTVGSTETKDEIAKLIVTTVEQKWRNS